MPLDDVSLPCSEAEFLAQLGGRIRTSREHCDMSRRELARRTGISERYIALIEAGKGNVSIVLLLRIACAIRCAQNEIARSADQGGDQGWESLFLRPRPPTFPP